MDPASSASSGVALQNTSPITDPAELREIIMQQGTIIRAYQNQLEALNNQRSSASVAASQEAPITRGRALKWASAVWDADPLIRASFSHFVEGIRKVFKHPAGGKDISVQLMELRQGSEAAADYTIRFRTLAAQHRLKPRPTDRARMPRGGHFSLPVCGHRYPPGQPTAPALGQGLRPLIDSGAAVNLIDRALVEELGIPTSPYVPSLKITAIDSQPIGEGYLKCQTELLGFQVGLFHHEWLAFYVTSSPANPVILGFPWLRYHDPQISWRTGELTRWSPACRSECLRNPVSRSCRTCRVMEATPVAQGCLP
ncbi:hypothetical protein QTP70_004390 [Hemibagrus guttatus]|uniref:Retrotransposon gag domain-containing protein n=1 Tax=Hemibagrus guttatus TaxID=175788 RepID=A0AAE0PVA0_9TELE|nr:hypothetical protein QTP70_004390 [Hemibagrus guttatus]